MQNIDINRRAVLMLGFMFGILGHRHAVSAPLVNPVQALFGDGSNAPFVPYDRDTETVFTLTGIPTLVSGSLGAFTASVSNGGLSFGTGDGAPDGAVLDCDDTLGNTWRITVSEVANAASIDTLSDIASTMTAMHAVDPAIDWTVLTRAGNYGLLSDDPLTIPVPGFSGTITDANSGFGYTAYSKSSRAVVSGGTVTLKGDQRWGPAIRRELAFRNSAVLAIEQLDFCAQPTVDQYNRDYNGGESETTQANHYMLDGDGGGVVRDCRLGGRRSNATVNRLQSGVSGFGIIEDNTFDYIYLGGAGQVTRRNIYNDIAMDAMRLGFGATSDWSRHVYGNAVFSKLTSLEWAGTHGDAIQVGATTTTAPGEVYIWDNCLYGEGGGNLQLIYMDDTVDGAYLTGEVLGNFLAGGKLQGVTLWNARNFLVAYNTIVTSGERSDSDPDTRFYLASESAKPWSEFDQMGNISYRNVLMDAGPFTTSDNNLGSENSDLDFTASNYSVHFDGDFGSGAGAPSITLTKGSDLDQYKSDVLAAYAISASGPSNGRGHSATYDVSGLPSLASNFDDLVEQAASTVIEMGSRIVLAGGDNQPISAHANTEYQVTERDGTIVTAWTSVAGTVDQDQIVTPRGQTSATNLEQLTVGVTVNGESYTGSLTSGVFPSAFKSATNNAHIDGQNLPAGTRAITVEVDIDVSDGTNGNFELFEWGSDTFRVDVDTRSGERSISFKMEAASGTTAVSIGHVQDDFPTGRARFVFTGTQDDGTGTARLAFYRDDVLIRSNSNPSQLSPVFADNLAFEFLSSIGADVRTYSLKYWTSTDNSAYTSDGDVSGFGAHTEGVAGDEEAFNDPPGNLTKAGTDLFTAPT